jgi:hypothetical protein
VLRIHYYYNATESVREVTSGVLSLKLVDDGVGLDSSSQITVFVEERLYGYSNKLIKLMNAFLAQLNMTFDRINSTFSDVFHAREHCLSLAHECKCLLGLGFERYESR